MFIPVPADIIIGFLEYFFTGRKDLHHWEHT